MTTIDKICLARVFIIKSEAFLHYDVSVRPSYVSDSLGGNSNTSFRFILKCKSLLSQFDIKKERF